MGKVYHLVLANQPKAALDWRFNLLAVVAGKRAIQAFRVLRTLHVVGPLAIAIAIAVDVRAEGKVSPPVGGTIVDRCPHLGDARPHHADEVAHITTRVVLIVLLKIQVQKKKHQNVISLVLLFLSDPSPIIGYACHSLTHFITDSLTH